MKAAIIDDDPVFLRQFSAQLKKLLPKADILCSSDGKGLDFSNFDIIFLDIDLSKQQNGIELAKSIPDSCSLVYITAYSDRYVQQVFLSDRTPDGYLLKPVEPKMLIHTLNHIQQKRSSSCLRLTINGMLTDIPCSSIIFLESENHNVRIFTDNRTLIVRAKLQDLMEKLPSSFARCHQSFAVNLEKVDRHTSEGFLLKSGIVVPFSRNRKKQALQNWTDWMVHHG